MGKRGPKPRGKIKTEWSSKLAYAIGLIATDGCLYKNSSCINLTSKDLEQIENFKLCLGLTCVVSKKTGGATTSKKYFVIQPKDVLFYKFLLEIGLTPNKSTTLGVLKIPDEYFFDFLRGCFDGDGCTYSYWDKRWRSSFMFYTEFVSASPRFINWVRSKIEQLAKISGHITETKKNNPCYQLKYAKVESLVLLRSMYYKKSVLCLSRKKLKIQEALGIIGEQLFV